MILEEGKEIVSNFVFGVLVTATWVQDHGKGWITFGLAVAYGVYKIINQRLDNELKRKQLEQWDKTRTTIEGDLEKQFKALKDVQIIQNGKSK